ncbi:hypothetical protein [Thalassotalea sp. PLHSN55]|uniref:hypothetical protein n=1 Tax=Thalassotalea sp. PLHSN55 TaxID=3435888 RepID=UPI003F8513A7
MIRVFFSVLMLITVSACSSYHQQNPIIPLQNGQYLQAEKALKKNHQSQYKNRLLLALELGVVNHLEGDYQQSNQHFHDAEKLIEQLYTLSLSESLLTSVTGSSYSTYKGQTFEYVLVNYYKALNFLMLASAEHKLDQEMLDRALVEVRRLGNRLRVLTDKSGGYRKSHNKSTEAQVFRLLEKALGQRVDAEKLIYKDDAYAHYVSAILYEMAGELDSARIEYQQAAIGYENGFSQQYHLAPSIAQDAWFDVLRVMQIAGGYDHDWQALAKEKLPAAAIDSLKQTKKNTGEVFVLQHVGASAQKRTLNLTLSIDEHAKALVLTPVLIGTRAERIEQMQWFEMLYADNDLFDVIQNYINGDIEDVVLGLFTKRIPLFGLWDDAVDIGLVDALDIPARVAVSYFPKANNAMKNSQLYHNGKLLTSLTHANALNTIAMQQHLIQANQEIQIALTREIAKALMVQKVRSEFDKKDQGDLGMLIGFAGQLANMYTASADTRNWLTLPENVFLGRVNLPVGKQQLELVTTFKNGHKTRTNFQVSVNEKRPTVWKTRTFEQGSLSIKQTPQ